MQSGDRGRWYSCLGAALCLLAGCAAARPQVRIEQAMKVDAGGASRGAGVADEYRARCPDVVEVAVAGRADLTRRAAVASDGRLDLGTLGRPRVEGLTPTEVAGAVASAAGMPTESVRARVVEYNSQQLYLFGEVIGLDRAVPYQGPETVLDLLRRVGGITAGAAPGDVHVIRPHVADGKAPEVFHIDLQAILLKNDSATNVRLRPFDQVYVGQAREAVLERCLPPWLRALLGLNGSPRSDGPPAEPDLPRSR